jgi:hypothetical protein
MESTLHESLSFTVLAKVAPQVASLQKINLDSETKTPLNSFPINVLLFQLRLWQDFLILRLAKTPQLRMAQARRLHLSRKQIDFSHGLRNSTLPNRLVALLETNSDIS